VFIDVFETVGQVLDQLMVKKVVGWSFDLALHDMAVQPCNRDVSV
jgi:hypothetical protein